MTHRDTVTIKGDLPLLHSVLRTTAIGLRVDMQYDRMSTRQRELTQQDAEALENLADQIRIAFE